jgi:O-antigen/teichoic acid export membrane protein
MTQFIAAALGSARADAVPRAPAQRLALFSFPRVFETPRTPLEMTTPPRIVRSTIWNALGQIAPLAAAFFTMPLLITRLGVERFGVLSLVWVFIGYVGLFDLGLGRALTQLIAKKIGSGDTGELPELVWTSVAIMAGLGVAGGAVVAAASAFLADHALRIPAAFRSETITSLELVAVSAPIITLSAAFRGILEAKHRFDLINQVRIPMGVFTFVGPVLVLPFKTTLPPLVLVLLLGRVVALAVSIYQCRIEDSELFARYTADRSLVRELLRFGSWMTLSNVIGPIMINMDRFFVASLVSVAAVTYYVTPFEIVSKLLVIPGALVGVLFPVFGATFVKDPASARRIYGQGVRWIALLLGPVVLVIVVVARPALAFWLKSPEFAQLSTRPLQLLAVGVLLNGLAMVPYALIQGAGRPDVTAKMHLLELILYLPVLYVLTLKLGIVGVAIAWLVRVCVDALLLFAYVRHFLLGARS